MRILQPVMKKRISTLLIFVLTAGLLLSLSACGKDAALPEAELSQLVADAIISENEDGYAHGECCGEGHKILGSRLSDDCLKIYALTMCGNYGFANDMFIKVSGSGVIPAVLTFEKDGADFQLLEIEYPLDGAYYEKSIKRMFPLRYRAQALTYSENLYDELSAQERSYAAAYLQSISREAAIGEYGDLNTVLLTDLGVSVEVSNALANDERLWQYPYWIGTSETVAQGKRYVRELTLDESAGRIIYETREKESGTVTEAFIFDAVTGEELTPSAEAISE